MIKSVVANLISYTTTYDDIMQEIHTETERQAYCRIGSITRAEWAEAGRLGIKPQLKLTLALIDYNEETSVEYEGKRYEVYRTYEDGEHIELYCELKGGTDGKDN